MSVAVNSGEAEEEEDDCVRARAGMMADVRRPRGLKAVEEVVQRICR